MNSFDALPEDNDGESSTQGEYYLDLVLYKKPKQITEATLDYNPPMMAGHRR